MYLYRVRSATPLQGCCLVTPRSSSQPWFFAVLPDDGAEQDAYLLQAPLDQLRCWESHMNWDYKCWNNPLWMGVWQPKNARTLCKTQIFRILLQGKPLVKEDYRSKRGPYQVWCQLAEHCWVHNLKIVGTMYEHVAIKYHQWSGHRYYWAFQHQ